MKNYIYKYLSQIELNELLQRPAIDLEKTIEIVKPVLNEIKSGGIEAVYKYAEKFEGLKNKNLLVNDEEFDVAEKSIDAKIKSAIDSAYENIFKFHKRQFPQNYEVETLAGVKCSREFRAIENVGLYIPGGNAVLPSTMLMLGVPAKIAGCKRIVACSPSKNGVVNNILLYTAKKIGVNEFYKTGGAQAVGLMAYGTNEIKKVEKIFGPGNQFVTVAKMLVSIDMKGCTIDMPAGPSEVLIIADKSANAEFIAADLLSQAEHGKDSQVILISNSELIIEKVNDEIQKQIMQLPRKDFANKSLENAFSLLVENIDQAINFSNDYAPEHLILHVQNAESLKSKIQNAGSVFLGEYSPESAGDYASGTNHSLPTYGYAKSFGGVTVESFMKSITFQNLTKAGLKNISKTVENLADAEELFAHKNAVSIRLK